ncbi:uncharacterized protein ASCRUDRAFT_92898, partial [Ascoidea rubescens DSM 1968]
GRGQRLLCRAHSAESTENFSGREKVLSLVLVLSFFSRLFSRLSSPDLRAPTSKASQSSCQNGSHKWCQVRL